MAIYTDYSTIENTITDSAAINNAIKNILLTPIGSMPGKPTFGSNLFKIPFSQLDHITISRCHRYIKEALRKWEKRISIVEILIEDAPEFNRVVATISYRFVDQDLEVTESISFNLVQ